MKILIVEDAVSLATAIAGMLHQHGHITRHAETGEEALDCFHEEYFDLVLMDVVMPGMGGIEATRKIKRLTRHRWIPLIIMTVLDDPEDIIAGLDAGADEYIIKPVHPEILLARIQAICRIAGFINALDDEREQAMRDDKTRSIGQLAAGVAHEFNTPLGVLKSDVNRLLEGSAALLPIARQLHRLLPTLPAPAAAELAPLLAADALAHFDDDLPELRLETHTALERMETIVNDLRDVTLPGHQGMFPVDLAKLLEQTLALQANRFSADVDISNTRSGDTRIDCFAPQIVLAISAVLDNAARAMAGHGRLTLHVSGTTQGVTLSISDNGPGIAPQHLPHLFDPFFTTREVGQGRGLGLYVAQRIVKAHQGRMVAESQPGTGCTIRFHFPRSTAS